MKDFLFEHWDDLPHHIHMNEHITPYTHKLLSSAQSIVGKGNAEIYKSAVFAKHNGRKRKIKNSRDIENLRERIAICPFIFGPC